jgi:FKBP-type peptidyl-prolyl cis-trans isomerase 2
MQQVKKGDTVKVHYKGTLTADGSIFDSSEGREPLEFRVGDGMVIFGFDNGVLEMKIGDKKVVDIPFMEGYGPLNDQMIIEFPLDQFPPDLGEPTIGMMLHLSDPEGNQLPVTITEIKEGTFVLDGNHPLAGKDLTFDIELVEIIG